MNVAVITLSMPLNLPVERDFDPHGCGLDEQCAWRNFGGLPLDAAQKKFASAPEIYQEDFMFMGPNAFLFYYPVIDNFLRGAISLADEERGDCQSWILPQCIGAHFDGANPKLVAQLKPSVLSLCRFMLDNLKYFTDDWDDPSEIEKQWVNLQQRLERC